MTKELEIKKGEIAEVQKGSPAELIIQAVQNNADLDKLKGLMELQEKWEQMQAKKAYNEEMVLVHREIPLVGKSLTNEQTHSSYASLDHIICKTKDIYTQHGFSVSFYEGETTKPEHIRICADVTHRAGHTQSYYYDVPMDGVGIKGNANMTKIHAKASSTSYGRRYLMCMIWNIPTGDDNDGDAGVEYISEAQLSQIMDIVDNNNINKEKFLAYLKVGLLNQLPAAKFAMAMTALEAKLKEQKAVKK